MAATKGLAQLNKAKQAWLPRFGTRFDAIITLINELRTDHGTSKTTVDALVTLANELRDDAATSKTTVDALVTLANELRTDHATTKTAVDEGKTLADELRTDHATFITAASTTKTLVDELKADFNLLRQNLFNCALQACGLAEGTNANTLKTANAISYAINGQLYTKAATDNIAMEAEAQQAISTFCEYLVTINAAGTVFITKGTELGTDTAVLPARPANEAVIGSFKIATDGATTFTSGTTDLGAAGITETYKDLMFANSGADAATAIAAADASAGPATITAASPTAGPATISAAAAAAGPATITAAAAAAGPATISAVAVEVLL